MSARKARLLRGLSIRRVDLVDRGANLDKASGEGAHVVLFKREDAANGDKITVVVRSEKDGKVAVKTRTVAKGIPIACASCDEAMPTKYGAKGMELPNYCPECGASISLSASGGSGGSDDDPVEKKREGAMKFDKAALPAEAKAAFDALEAKIAELEKAAKKDPPDPEADVLKGVPEAVRALVEKANAQTAEALAEAKKAREESAAIVDERRLDNFRKVASAFDHLPDWTSEKGGKLLKAANERLAKEDYESLVTLLKAADEAIEAGGLFSEAGRSGAGGGVPNVEDRVDTLVAECIQKKEAETPTEALSLVFQRHPDLYRKYRGATSTRVGNRGDGSDES